MWILGILVQTLGAVLMAAVFLASGARLRRLLRLPTFPGERWAVDLVLGALCCGTWVLALGLVGALRPTFLVVLFIAQGAVGRWRGEHRPTQGLAIAGVAGLGNLAVALGPPHFYDAMVYHLGLPWQAIREGAVTAHPENVFAAFPPLAQLPAALPLSLGALSAPALLHWFSWAAAAVAAASIARRLGAPRGAAHLLTAVVMLPAATPLIPGFPAAEGWFLAALIPALGAVVGPTCRRSSLSGAMLLLGAACAFRLQGVPWLALAAVIWLGRTRNAGAVIRGLPWAAVGAAPWWVKNLILLHDPFAPIGWRREGIETLWRDGASLLNLNYTPAEILMALPANLAPAAPLLVPILLGAAVAAATSRRCRPTLWVSALSLGTWAATGALLRFLAPTVVLLSMCIAAWRPRNRIRAIPLVLLGWCLALGGWAHVRWFGLVHPFAVMSHSYVEAAPLVAPNPPFRAYHACDELLPPAARVLVIGDARTFGLPRPFIVTSQHDPSPLRPAVETGSPERIHDSLMSLGVTHFVINHPEMDRLHNGYPVTPWATSRGQAAWSNFLLSIGPPIASIDGVEIFRLPARDPS